MSRTRITVAVLAATVLLVTVAVPTFAIDFNIVSDLHYDPAYGTTSGYKCTTKSAALMGETGCDSPQSLITSVLSDMSSQSNAYTVVAGDWQRHYFSTSGLNSTAVFGPLSQWFAQVTTSGEMTAPAFASTIGNNDVVPDYQFNYSDINNTELAARVTAMEQSGLLTQSEGTQMKLCGFYAHTDGNVSIIALHTLIWAYSVTPAVPDTVTDPCEQFSFLEGQLSAARAAKRKVIIIGHIPPQVNVYDVIKRGSFSSESADMYWKPAYVQQYAAILNSYTDVVTLQIFGHTHMLSVFADPKLGVPGIITPAVTPIYGNRPSYLVGSFSKHDWTLQNLRQRFLRDSGTWKNGLNVLGALGLQSGFDNVTEVQSALTHLKTNDVLWNNYLQLHGGGEPTMVVFPSGKCNAFCRAVTVCSMLTTDYSELKSCTTTATTPTVPPINLSGSIVTLVLILGVSIAVTLLFSCSKVVPKIIAGEIKFDKFDYDFRAELLGMTSKKEKLQRAEDERQRQENRLAVQARYRDEQEAAAATVPAAGPAPVHPMGGALANEMVDITDERDLDRVGHNFRE